MEITREAVVTELPPRPVLRWSAILGGLFFVVALGWMLMLLGGALGMSIADASDLDALDDGFGIAAAIWLVASAVIAYFVGGMLVARLAGEPDRSHAAMHGVTLWSVAITCTLALGMFGLKGLMTAGAGAIAKTAEVAADAAGRGASALGSLTASGGEGGESSFVNAARDVLEESLADVHEASFAGSAEPVDGKMPANQGKQGPTSDEIRNAVREIDGQTIGRLAAQLLAGRTEAAKLTLERETSLEAEDVNAIVDRASTAVNERVRELREEVEEAAETVADYTQAVLWAWWIGALLALIACAGGAALGASSVERLHLLRVRRTASS